MGFFDGGRIFGDGSSCFYHSCKQRKVFPDLSLQTPRELFLCRNNSLFFFLFFLSWKRAVFPRVLHAAGLMFGNKHNAGCGLLLAESGLTLCPACLALAAAGVLL